MLGQISQENAPLADAIEKVPAAMTIVEDRVKDSPTEVRSALLVNITSCDILNTQGEFQMLLGAYSVALLK